MTASLDHQSTAVGGPAFKNSNPLWQTADILKICRITITQPCNFVQCPILPKFGSLVHSGSATQRRVRVKTGTGSRHEPSWAALFRFQDTSDVDRDIICTEFGTRVENGPRLRDYQNTHLVKYKMAVGAKTENG